MIGTGGHGHTFRELLYLSEWYSFLRIPELTGAGRMQRIYYSDSVIYGFSHTHLNGTGVSDYGDIMLMPDGKSGADPKDYSSKFSHKMKGSSWILLRKAG
ncbi:hypothetical protein EJ377_04770 [Chryseobacterium arthrosphaerae]|uniref:Glycosyl hydrolase family 92 N-terminal domain-containing protein n=1 Tax=Chryseobacterium arthrosphaerae TaxID=651561 RepID=A0A3S0QVW3_9FLAO|nr:hypothetical protein EJ377_04770 [Chryseobacterium arthrosphaerae]